MNGLTVKEPKMISCGIGKFAATTAGNQTVSITFPFTFERKPIIVVSWCDSANTPDHIKDLIVKKSSVTVSGFNALANRISPDADWYFSWVAIEPDTTIY